MYNYAMRYLFLILFLVSTSSDLQAASSRRLFSRQNFTKEAIMRDVKSPKAWAKAFMPVFLLISLDLLNNSYQIGREADLIAEKAAIFNDVMNSLKRKDYEADINKLRLFNVENRSALHPCHKQWMGGKQSLIELLHKKGLVFETNEVIKDQKKMNAFVKTIIANMTEEYIFSTDYNNYIVLFDKKSDDCSGISLNEKSILGKVNYDKEPVGRNLLGMVYALISKSVYERQYKYESQYKWPNSTIRQRLIGYIQYRFGLMSTSF